MELEKLLSARITKHCLALYRDGHYKHAAREAMTQVELALKEKGRVNTKKFGVMLIDSLFKIGSKEQSVKLFVPLGEDLQEQAEQLFKAAFAYYRNYAAHDGSKIGETQSLRIMILASELLDLIDASSLTFADIGGIDGLIRTGTFNDQEQILEFLKLLDSYHITDDVFDGLFEEMAEIIGVEKCSFTP